MTTAEKSDITETIHVGNKISVGFAEPASALMAITVDGKSCMAAEFITKNKHTSLVLFPISETASMPEGVAPLPNPKKFAEIFVIIAFCAFSL